MMNVLITVHQLGTLHIHEYLLANFTGSVSQYELDYIICHSSFAIAYSKFYSFLYKCISICKFGI